jgi:FtsP/CotA-like multicopper oxidase with cupredoxin domain
MLDKSLNRRRFVSMLGLAGASVAGVGFVACGDDDDGKVDTMLTLPTPTAAPPTHTAHPTGAQPVSAQTAGATPTAQTVDTPSGMTADEMDAHHLELVKAFPQATAAAGNQPLAPRIENGVKVYDIVCEELEWETKAGTVKTAWAYNGQVPGPEIRVTEGDTVRLNITNKLVESTSIHFHGVRTPNAMDGVPGITQDPIKPGQTFTYEFTVREGNAGTHMYHSHHNAAFQVSMGLLGAFIIEPRNPASRPAFDREYSIVINDGPLGFTLNGKEFPATEPLVAKLGETILVRYLHEGQMLHPMHLHGLPQLVIAKDGYLLPQPFMCDTLNVAPGERWEVLVHCDDPGVWAFHCHVLTHAESPQGMFGMVTALIVEE